jgi:uncharacterized protein (TIGR03663 family)
MDSPSTKSRLAAGAFILIALAAFMFRAARLEKRPMHGDEANQAYKAGILLDTGVYRYDPIEHHGPTIYYFSLPVAWLTGARSFAETTEFTYRIVPVIFGTGIVLLLFLLREPLGTPATLCAAALTAISPAMVYYSRYFIQETLLVFFVFGMITAGWRYYRAPHWRWAAAAGLCAGLAHASKETCVLAFGVAPLSAAATWVCSRLRDGNAPAEKQSWRAAHLAVFIGCGAAISMLFFSSFLSHPLGVLDSVLTYLNYVRKADSGHMHDKPWPYYLRLLLFTRRAPWPWFSEGLILGLGAAGAVVALTKRTNGGPGMMLGRFLAFYTIGMTAVYSIIPYKTPWCAINFLQPMIVLAGIGAWGLIRAARFRFAQIIVAGALAASAAQLAAQSCRASYVFSADIRNPYVYAHTSSAILRLVERVHDIAAVAPERQDLLIHVVHPQGDYWPLPWYLRAYPNVGYWTAVPERTDGAIIIAAPEMQEKLAQTQHDTYHVEFHALRPGVLLLVSIRTDLWDAFMATRGG